MPIPEIGRIVLVGAGATLVLDGWFLVLRRLGIPTLGFALIGRWAGHALHGKFMHPSIAKAPPIHGELLLGWATHYAVGIAFAGLLFALMGADWSRNPSLLPAVLVGMATVTAPLFVMQPAMGAGIAASKTPTPLKNCARSLLNHTVFGIGLYLSVTVVAWMTR